MGIAEVITAARSPWQNAYVERLIGSIRRECLDHVVVFNERHLLRVLSSYVDYYHRSRTHLSLAKDCPEVRPVMRLGKVIAGAARMGRLVPAVRRGDVALSLGIGDVIVRSGLPPLNFFVTGQWTVCRQFSRAAPQTGVNFGMIMGFPEVRSWTW
jgi:hypothetical protein